MTLSLAADVLHYMPEELDSLAQHIQTTGGELTSPIMQVYEEDIRTPIKSAIRGTLIRGILVQVQKAKVCLFLFLYFFSGPSFSRSGILEVLFYTAVVSFKK